MKPAEQFRATMADIVSCVEAPDYQELDYASGYWPDSMHPISESEWSERLRGIDECDLYAPVARNPEHSIAARS